MPEIPGSRDLERPQITRRTMLKGAAAASLVAPLSGLVDPSRVQAAIARQGGTARRSSSASMGRLPTSTRTRNTITARRSSCALSMRVWLVWWGAPPTSSKDS